MGEVGRWIGQALVSSEFENNVRRARDEMARRRGNEMAASAAAKIVAKPTRQNLIGNPWPMVTRRLWMSDPRLAALTKRVGGPG